MADSTELYYAEMEAARNAAEDSYFKARPQLLRSFTEQALFRAGFERAFAPMWNQIQSLRRESSQIATLAGNVMTQSPALETRTAPEAPEQTWICSICSRSNYVTVTHCEQCEYSRMVMRGGKSVPRDGHP